MPNYCTNYLILGGNTEILKDIFYETQEFNQHGNFLQLLRPMPDLEESEIRDWRLSNWGTKWDADHVSVDFYNDILTVYFDTAWSPPVEAVEYFCSWFGVHGRLHYYEGDGNFVGFYDSENDKNCELEFNSHDVNKLIDAFDHPPLKSEYERWNTYREMSYAFFKDILEIVKDYEDEMEDEDDE